MLSLILLTEVWDDNSYDFNLNSNKDKAVEIETTNTESFSLLSDSEISTTIDKDSIKSASQSNLIV